LPLDNTLLTLISHIDNLTELRRVLSNSEMHGHQIGFVPTMGALHSGHLNLVERSVNENNLTVVSIYVNPTQFNNPSDLQNYPRTLENDLSLLGRFEQVCVFVPSTEMIYPPSEIFHSMPLGFIGSTLEGEFRPGHFDGVVHVVHNLFKLVQPHRAYFGKKDFQQLAIIRKLQTFYDFPIEIVGCDTIREDSGLALSSRNMRLTSQQREDALIIFQTLTFCKEGKKMFTPQELRLRALSVFENGNLILEYLAIVDAEHLTIIDNWERPAVCCIAAFCGEVRLIDNMEL